NIIEELYLLDIHDNQLFNTFFHNQKTYPYTPNQLDYLIKKSSLFLLEYFQNIFQNIGKSKIIKTKNNIRFFMATLDEILSLKCLSTGYHTAHLPLVDACDHCIIPIRHSTGQINI
ncbi:15503_t:CDS:1, partial [Racocetra fulgida]